jgi:hypothetical protein
MSQAGPADPPAASEPGQATLEFALTEQDFLDANLRHLRERLRRATLLQGAATAAVAVVVATSSLPPKLLAWMLPAVYAINTIAIYPRARHRLRHAYRSRGALHAVTRVILSADGYRTESAGTEQLIRWPAFTHYTETPTAYLLYHGGEAEVLPKSALGEAQRRDVPELFRLWIGQSGAAGGRGFPVAPAPA